MRPAQPDCGRMRGVVLIFRDISERRHPEATLAATAERVTTLLQELQDTDRRKDEFLATLAHELRNPLAPACNSLQLMKRAPTPI
jgi:signal transduction histidine kinase